MRFLLLVFLALSSPCFAQEVALEIDHSAHPASMVSTGAFVHGISLNANYYNPFYFYGYSGRVPYGWGHYWLNRWPVGYWNYPQWNGYSYYSYYNYQPYYASFAVISYSASGDTWGSAWGQPSRAAATSYAYQNCNQADCRPVVWVQGGCAAIATSKATGRVAWGTGYNQGQALQYAYSSCQQNPGGAVPTDCTNRAWVCSY
ncbi:MAG: DUF4189 domain-containing protein [Proteobacteria bacterium]|nr:DUF4189 domain-containing protein [Pseudomonadota bacterium]